MSALTVTAHLCSGGNHVHVETTGATSLQRDMFRSDFNRTPSERDQEGFLLVLFWLARQDKTLAQTLAAFDAGVSVTA